MSTSSNVGRIGQQRGIGFGILLVVPAIVWFVKVQGALNRYRAAKAVAI